MDEFGNVIFDTDCQINTVGDVVTVTYPIHVFYLADIGYVESLYNGLSYIYLPVKVYGYVPEYETNREVPCEDTVVPLWECPDNADGVTENTCGGFKVSTSDTRAYNSDAYLVNIYIIKNKLMYNI